MRKSSFDDYSLCIRAIPISLKQAETIIKLAKANALLRESEIGTIQQQDKNTHRSCSDIINLLDIGHEILRFYLKRCPQIHYRKNRGLPS